MPHFFIQNCNHLKVNSILQQQAQLMLNQQKLDEVKKMAKATKMAVKSSAKSAKSSSSSVSKGSLGTIGDLRSKYRLDLKISEI